jgi:hypothetical protein
MTAEDYLKHAEECERLAALAELNSNKRALLQSAEMWRRLAAAGTPTDRGGRGPPLSAAT